jgi:S1-C subfamily serine protease
MVKEFLSQKGVNYEERDVSVNQAYAEEMVKNTGQMGVPVILIDGQAVIGFDRGRLEQILTQTQTKRNPTLGASIADASKITAKMGTGVILGAYIGRVRPNSIAEKSGLTAGDIITELNLKPITNANDLESALSKFSPGSRFTITLIRDNRTLTKEGVF